MMKLLTPMLSLALFAPVLVLAADADLGYFSQLVTTILDLVDKAIPLVLALALLFFLWGVFQYFIFGAGDEDKRETGKMFMIYSLVGLVLMVAVWGIVSLIVSVLGVDSTATGKVPLTPTR